VPIFQGFHRKELFSFARRPGKIYSEAANGNRAELEFFIEMNHWIAGRGVEWVTV